MQLMIGFLFKTIKFSIDGMAFDYYPDNIERDNNSTILGMGR